MNYDELELSTEEGAPVRLYEAVRQSMVYRYTNMQEDVTVDGEVYKAVAISDGGITKSGQATADTVQITLPLHLPLSLLFIGTPPSDSILMRIRKMHRNPDTGEITTAPIIWVGEVTGHRRLSENAALTLLCDTISVTFSRGGLRLVWARGCPHLLYDGECTVDPSQYQTPVASIQVLDGRTVQIEELTSQEAGYFVGGMLQWTTGDGFVERRWMEYVDGTRATIFGTTDGIAQGTPGIIYPGCDYTIATCNKRFNNHPNYGGFDFLPGKSPFDGTPVF